MNNTSKPGDLSRILEHIAGLKKPTPRDDAIKEVRSADELLSGKATPPTIERRRAAVTLSEQEREAVRVEMEAQRRDDYLSSLEEDASEEETESEEDGGPEWDMPSCLWHEFTDADRRSLKILWPYHQKGLGVDDAPPVTPEVAERYLPRLETLHERLSTIPQFEVRADAIKVLFVFRCAIVSALGRDPIAERQAARKKQRDRERILSQDERSRKKEHDRTRNADPARKAAEAARQRARRKRLLEGAEA